MGSISFLQKCVVYESEIQMKKSSISWTFSMEK